MTEPNPYQHLDCSDCKYDDRGIAVYTCESCEQEGEEVLNFLICHKLLQQPPEGTA